MSIPARRLVDDNGAGLAKAEDAAHTSGDYGLVLLAVRKDTAAALAATDADYIPLIVDASGRLHIAPLVTGSASIGQVTANAGTNLNTSALATSALQLAAGHTVTLAAGTAQAGARSKCTLLNSGVLATDTNVKAAAGEVYWLTVSDTAALAIELNDSTDNNGTDKWALDLPADGYGHFIFDPPIEFATGIYLDVSTATCKVTIGYK